MRKVLLAETEIQKDNMGLITAFVHAAAAQGFDIDWVEAVFDRALLNDSFHFRNILLKYIEIVPEQSDT